MNDYGDFQARYIRIANELRKQILSGTFPPHTRLPSQRVLAEQWGTTVITVREALQLLREEGLIYVEHGLGTFVADLGSSHDLFQLASFSEEMAERGISIETQVVECDFAARSIEASRALDLSPDTPLTMLARLRLVDNVPVVYQRSYLPHRYREIIAAYEPDVPLYAFLRDRAGLIATTSQEILRPCQLGALEARLLQCPVGALAFLSLRTSFNSEAEPMLYDQAFLPDMRIGVFIHRVGKRSTVEYRPWPAKEKRNDQ